MREKISRFDKYLKLKGINDNQATIQTGLSQGLLGQARTGKSDLGPKAIEKILKTYQDLDRVWLLTGEGEMLRVDNKPADPPTDSKDVIMIPVLNLDARGGFLSNDAIDTVEYAVGMMPFSREIARDGDIVIPVYGDSMTPKYPAGSMILIRNIPQWREYIEYGASYVLELADERRLIKNIQKAASKDRFLLESVNPKYEPAEIAISFVKNIFRVLMTVRRETL